MQCPVCHAANPANDLSCRSCGEPLPPRSPAEAAGALPADVVLAEGKEVGHVDTHLEKDKDSDIVSIFIPYKNPKALAAYYCGFFALIPVLGFVLGPVAIWLGISGVRTSTANPAAKGMVHAITGIVLGVLALLCWNPFWCVLLVLAYFYLP